MQNGCQFHIKFHEESKNELYLISEVGTESNFCRSYIIRYEVILQVKLSYFRLWYISDINFRRIDEYNRCLPNGANLKFKVKIFKMGVD